MIPLPNMDKSAEEILTSLVNEIIYLKSKNVSSDTHWLERKVNFIIYKLYNLTYNDVLIIDPQTSITQEEYETVDY